MPASPTLAVLTPAVTPAALFKLLLALRAVTFVSLVVVVVVGTGFFFVTSFVEGAAAVSFKTIFPFSESFPPSSNTFFITYAVFVLFAPSPTRLTFSGDGDGWTLLTPAKCFVPEKGED